MSLPHEQISKVLANVTSGFERCPVDRHSFHGIVERELNERYFEPGTKVAKLIILCALANTLCRRGHRFCNGTRRVLRLCRDMIPVCLMLAVDDHYEILQTQCY